MIFKPQLVKLILSGRKTQTRRPRKSGDCTYVVGRSYALQPGRTKKAVARILITDIREERLGDITPQDAQREGFKRRDQFIDYWRELYGSVDEDQPVWVISFRLHHGEVRRLLHRDSSHGYTDKRYLALDEEPEAIDATTLERYAAEAKDLDAERERRRREEWERQSLARRVAALEAQPGNADLTRILASIERKVQAGEKKRRQAA